MDTGDILEEERMGAEFLLIVLLALFGLLACVVTISAWQHGYAFHVHIIARVRIYAQVLAANAAALAITWIDGIDPIQYVEVLSIQAVLLFAALILLVLYINETDGQAGLSTPS